MKKSLFLCTVLATSSAHAMMHLRPQIIARGIATLSSRERYCRLLQQRLQALQHKLETEQQNAQDLRSLFMHALKTDNRMKLSERSLNEAMYMPYAQLLMHSENRLHECESEIFVIRVKLYNILDVTDAAKGLESLVARQSSEDDSSEEYEPISLV